MTQTPNLSGQNELASLGWISTISRTARDMGILSQEGHTELNEQLKTAVLELREQSIEGGKANKEGEIKRG